MRQLGARSTSSEWNQTADEPPDHVDARFCELEADIERLEAKRHAYYPDDIARGGAFVILNHDGTVRIERGFIRTEDEKPEPQAEHSADEPSSANVDVEGVDGRVEHADGAAGEDAADEEDNDSPLSDILVRNLTAHRTLGLRLNLSEQPDLAVVAVTHSLASQIFYLGAEAHVVGIQPIKIDLAAHADGIEGHPGWQRVGGTSCQLGKADAPRRYQSVDLCG